MAIANKGNISEGILGCALIAKFGARTGSHIRKITSADVQKILSKLRGAKVVLGVKGVAEFKYDIDSLAKDKVTISLKLTQSAIEDLFNKQNAGEMSPLINSACSYVNSKRIEAQAFNLFENRISNKINIEVDGISSNTQTKADIIVKNDSVVISEISLKTGGLQIGQVGGDTFAVYVRLFLGGQNPKTGIFEPGLGVHVNQKVIEQKFDKIRGVTKTKDSLQRATKFIYKRAAELINLQPHAAIADSLEKFLGFHATRHDDRIQMVVLEQIMAGRHKVLNPAKLSEGLKSLPNIKAVYKDGVWPTVILYSGVSAPHTMYGPDVLFAIRVTFDNRWAQVRNIVEKGKLFEKLLTEEEG